MDETLKKLVLIEIMEPGTFPEIYESQEHIEIFASQVYEVLAEEGWDQ